MASNDLPPDIINLISKKIEYGADLKRFRSVCSDWRNFSVKSCEFKSLLVPSIRSEVVSYVLRESVLFCFWPFVGGEGWFLQLSGQMGQTCKIMENLSKQNKYYPDTTPTNIIPKFLNLLQFNGPVVSQYHFLEPRCKLSHRFWVKKAVILPGYDGCELIVVALHGGALSFWRKGDQMWGNIDVGGLIIDDVVIFKGICHAISSTGVLLFLDPHQQPQTLTTATLEEQSTKVLVGCKSCLYMVSKLYIKPDILTVGVKDFIDGNLPYRVNHLLYVLNESRWEWDVVENLEGKALLLGPYSAACVDVKDFPGFRANSLYLTDFQFGHGTESTVYGFRSGIHKLDQPGIEMLTANQTPIPPPPPSWFVTSTQSIL